MNQWQLVRYGKVLGAAALAALGMAHVIGETRRVAREVAEGTVEWHEMQHHDDGDDLEDDSDSLELGGGA